jgi:hypothetical protein
VFEKFKQYKALVENEIGHKIKVLRSDNGGEFVSKKFDTFLAECGIQRHTSAPYSPQQNGVAECANRTIMECARSMILAQGLGLEFWGEAMNTAVYIKNRCPTKALDSKTPQEAWSGRKPDVSHLRVFGCKAFAHVPDEKRTKLKSKSIPCVFLGYHQGTKAYCLMCVESKKILKIRDVVFIERSNEIGGVLHPKKVENVVVEVEGEEPLTFSEDTLLNEETREGVQVSPHQVLHRKKNLLFRMTIHLMSLHNASQGKDLRGNEGSGLEIGGLLPRRWSVPPLHFWRNPKILKKHWHVKVPRSGSAPCNRNMILS